ncbi:hypothetical protein B0H19DRAFT_1374166 [Mycena capillaripes]|nr:hypothetical protein B0H19DRAFT_1374166 [Mycena capillaripes]
MSLPRVSLIVILFLLYHPFHSFTRCPSHAVRRIDVISTPVAAIEAHPPHDTPLRATPFSKCCALAHERLLSVAVRLLLPAEQCPGNVVHLLMAQAVDIMCGGIKVKWLPEEAHAIVSHRVVHHHLIKESLHPRLHFHHRLLRCRTPSRAAAESSHRPWGAGNPHSHHSRWPTPLAFVLDAANFIGAASVPMGHVCLGSALARLHVPHGSWNTLPVGAILSFSIGNLLVSPLIGVFITKSFVVIALDDKILQFICMFFACLLTATTQVASGTWSAEHLSAFLIPQYALMLLIWHDTFNGVLAVYADSSHF